MGTGVVNQPSAGHQDAGSVAVGWVCLFLSSDSLIYLNVDNTTRASTHTGYDTITAQLVHSSANTAWHIVRFQTCLLFPLDFLNFKHDPTTALLQHV